MEEIIQVKGLTARLYELYKDLKDWYLNLTEDQLEALRKSEPDLLASIQFLLKLVEGEENV